MCLKICGELGVRSLELGVWSWVLVMFGSMVIEANAVTHPIFKV